LPFVGYGDIESLLTAARESQQTLRAYLESHELLAESDAEALFHPRNLTALGYDEALVAGVESRSGEALRAHARSQAPSAPEQREDST
jgi:hypothetical protein